MDKNYTSFFTFLQEKYEICHETKNELISSTKTRRIKKGNYLFQEGDKNSKLFFIVSGALRLYSINDDFKEFVIKFAFENQLICEMNSFLYNSVCELNLQALENTIVIEFNSSSTNSFFKDVNGLRNYYKDFIEMELSKLEKRITNQLVNDAHGRYLDFTIDYGNFYNRIPDRYIAQYIGVTPEFFSKLKKNAIRGFLDLPNQN